MQTDFAFDDSPPPPPDAGGGLFGPGAAGETPAEKSEPAQPEPAQPAPQAPAASADAAPDAAPEPAKEPAKKAGKKAAKKSAKKTAPKDAQSDATPDTPSAAEAPQPEANDDTPPAPAAAAAPAPADAKPAAPPAPADAKPAAAPAPTKAPERPYQVLALKYRPQTFDDLVGQDHIKVALANAIGTGKVAHAFLFAGSRGTGKTTTARIMAKALNCLSSDGPTASPCGTCAACVEIADSRDMDVLEIDGASNNGVEQIRELRHTIENRPARDRYRVIIIDEVHMLSTAAFNALLKTLEEPPRHVKFIFATTDAHKVPETIHSRCQHYDFRRLTVAEIVSSLQAICELEGISPGEGVLETIATIVEGGMRDSQSRLDQLIAFRGTEPKLEDLEQVFGLVGRSRLLRLLGDCRGGNVAPAFEAAEEVFSQGKDLASFVGGLLHLLRDLMVVGACGADFRGLDLLPEERQALAEEAGHWTPESLVYGIELLTEASRRLKTADVPRVVLEATLVKLAHLQSLRSLRDVVGALETIIRGGNAAPRPGPGGPPPGKALPVAADAGRDGVSAVSAQAGRPAAGSPPARHQSKREAAAPPAPAAREVPAAPARPVPAPSPDDNTAIGRARRMVFEVFGDDPPRRV